MKMKHGGKHIVRFLSLFTLMALGLGIVSCTSEKSAGISGEDTDESTVENTATAGGTTDSGETDAPQTTQGFPAAIDGAAYYVDSVYGDDENDGRSPDKAFRTLSRANKVVLKEGESLLFRAGCEFKGTLNPKRERDGTTVYIGRYGEGDDPAVIAPRGNALTLTDFDFVEVSNLTLTNPNGGCGIYINIVSGGAVKGIHIKNCTIKDVNKARSVYNYESGGIICAAFSDTPGWFEDLVIEDNTISNVARTGILLTSLWANRPTKSWGKNEYVSDSENWWPAYGVVVRGNEIDRTGGDGIVLIGTQDALIEYNTVYRINFEPVTPCANAGIWPQSSNGCVIRYNEVAYSLKPEGVADATAFDVDNSCRDTIIEYNYSHDNQGGFLLLCEVAETKDSDGFTGTVVRNNVSINDGEVFGSLIPIVGPVRDVVIENNTFYFSGRWVSNIMYVWSENGQNQVKGVQFRRNIVVSDGNGNGHHLANGENFTFEGNLYWGKHKGYPEDEISPIVADPMIDFSGKAPKGLESALRYAPKADSPAFSSSIAAVKPADKDYFGTDVGNTKYIGAFVKEYN
jgi:hypothetical protein